MVTHHLPLPILNRQNRASKWKTTDIWELEKLETKVVDFTLSTNRQDTKTFKYPLDTTGDTTKPDKLGRFRVQL